MNVAFYGLIFVLSLYFQNVAHYSPLVTGLAFAPATAMVLVANLSAGRLVERVGARAVLVAGAAAMAIGLIGLLIVSTETPYYAIVGQLVALSFGIGAIVPTMTSALLGSVDKTRSGVASGTLNTARQTGSVIGVALFGALLGTDLVHGLRSTVGISIVLSILVGCLALVVERPAHR